VAGYFATDNNGVIVELPSVDGSGVQSTLTGSLVFGIGTQSNNSLGTATIYTLDPDTGNLSITFNNSAFSSSFIDSGSNANYFVDSSIPTCSPASSARPAHYQCRRPLPASMTRAMRSPSASPTRTLCSTTIPPASRSTISPRPRATAIHSTSDCPFSSAVIVYTAIADESTPGGNGPYVAF
jgi:hypothetical protein